MTEDKAPKYPFNFYATRGCIKNNHEAFAAGKPSMITDGKSVLDKKQLNYIHTRIPDGSFYDGSYRFWRKD